MAGEVATLVIRVGSKDVTVATGQLQAMQKAAKGVARQLDQTSDSAGALSGRAKRQFKEMGSSFKIVGRDLSRYITLPFLAASGASLKFAKDLTTGLGQVETLIAGTGSRIYELQDAVTGMAKETGLSFDDLNRGLYETISAFQDGADTVGRFETAAKAAVAGNASVLDSVKLLSAVTKAYGDTSEEAAQKVADLAFETVRLGQTTFKDLANAIQQVTANSARLGVTQEELFSVFSTLTGVTGDAANVSTQFNRALLSLSNPTKELQALFAEYRTEQGKIVTTGKEFIEVSGGTVQAFKKIYDNAERTGQPLEKFITRQTGVIAVTALANQQFDVFTEKSSEIAKSVGAMEKAYFAATLGIDEFQRILKQVGQTIASAGAEVGQIMLPTIVTLAQRIAEVVEDFSKLDETIQRNRITAIAFAAALGPLLIIIGSLLRTLKLFGDLKLLAGAGALPFLNPVTLGITAAAIAGVLLVLGKFVKQIKLEAEALEDLKRASSGFQDARTTFIDIATKFNHISDAEERNKAIAWELSQVYGRDFVYALNQGENALQTLYDKFLEIEALKYQDKLEAQYQQLEAINEKYRGVFNLGERQELRFGKRFEDELTRLGMTVDEAADELAKNPLFTNELFINGFFGTKLRADNFAEQLTGILNNRANVQRVVDEMTALVDETRKEVEMRTGGQLSLSDLILEEGVGGDFLVKAAGILSGLNGALGDATDPPGGAGGGDKAARLKTWADYFADITGVAGEAFASIEYDDDDKAVGFFKGKGVLAADAYAQAFANELSVNKSIAEAVGRSISIEENRDTIKNQLDKTVSDLSELLTATVNSKDFNKEMGTYNLADLLTGDVALPEGYVPEEVLQIFGLSDSSIKGMVAIAKERLSAFTTETHKYANELLADPGFEMPTIFGEGMFNFPDDGTDRIRDNINTLNELIDEVGKAGGFTGYLTLLRDGQVEELKLAGTTFSNIMSDLEGAPSLGDALADSLVNAFKNASGEADVMNVALAGTMSILSSGINVAVEGMGNAFYEMSRVNQLIQAGVVGSEAMNDAWGNLASSIAQAIVQTAQQVGLQLIGAGAVELANPLGNPAEGWAMIGWGAALLAGSWGGQAIMGANQGKIDAAEANAQGGVYSGSEKITKYAHGGVLGDYVNSIVDKPTYFANGSALMGEAGAEAIMPLTRMSNGDLGVQTAGGYGSRVNVTVHNYGNSNAEVTQTENSDGSVDISVVIDKKINSAIAAGKADSGLKSRYGLSVKGLN